MQFIAELRTEKAENHPLTALAEQLLQVYAKRTLIMRSLAHNQTDLYESPLMDKLECRIFAFMFLFGCACKIVGVKIFKLNRMKT